MKEPNRTAVTRTILPTLATFQEIVGGYIEGLRFASSLTMYVDEEGLLKGLPENIIPASGPPLVGTLVITKCRRNGEPLTLSEAEAARAIAALTTLAL